MPTRHIALVPESGMNPSELARISAGLQKQVTRDLAPIWDVSATVDPFPSLEDVPAGYWPVILTFRDLGGDLGVHVDGNGQPYALVEISPSWSLTASHVCLEMLTDPFGGRTFPGPSPRADQGDVEFMGGVCDACEHPDYAYLINDVLVSDFCTPAFWDRGAPSRERRSFTGSVEAPFQVLPGGHLSWYDPATNAWWLRRHADGTVTDIKVGIADPKRGTVREFISGHVPHLESTKMTAEAFEARVGVQRQRAFRASQSRAYWLRASLEKLELDDAVRAALGSARSRGTSSGGRQALSALLRMSLGTGPSVEGAMNAGRVPDAPGASDQEEPTMVVDESVFERDAEGRAFEARRSARASVSTSLGMPKASDHPAVVATPSAADDSLEGDIAQGSARFAERPAATRSTPPPLPVTRSARAPLQAPSDRLSPESPRKPARPEPLIPVPPISLSDLAATLEAGPSERAPEEIRAERPSPVPRAIVAPSQTEGGASRPTSAAVLLPPPWPTGSLPTARIPPPRPPRPGVRGVADATAPPAARFSAAPAVPEIPTLGSGQAPSSAVSTTPKSIAPVAMRGSVAVPSPRTAELARASLLTAAAMVAVYFGVGALRSSVAPQFSAASESPGVVSGNLSAPLAPVALPPSSATAGTPGPAAPAPSPLEAPLAAAPALPLGPATAVGTGSANRSPLPAGPPSSIAIAPLAPPAASSVAGRVSPPPVGRPTRVANGRPATSTGAGPRAAEAAPIDSFVDDRR